LARPLSPGDRKPPLLLIAFIASTVFYLSSRHIPFLLIIHSSVAPSTAVGVHLVMSLIVIPLSAVPKPAFSTQTFLTQLIIHILFVGVPIGLTVSHFSR
jgi:hypothetical protein